MLARYEPRKPKQASLRRAVSAAYFSLFHLLTAEATSRMVTGSNRVPLRYALGRAFSHATMRDACTEISKVNGGKLRDALCGNSVPTDLKDVTRAFVDLQQMRHEADYDLSRVLTRLETLAPVTLAEQSVLKWRNIRKTIPADAFLFALLAKHGMCR